MHAEISDFVADIVQNAWEAGANRIELSIHTDGQEIDVNVKDNGKGMTPDAIASALDPFVTEAGKHTARRVGLGLPFLKQAVDAVEGKFSILSTPGQGTTVYFLFPLRHADTPPLGDLSRTLASLIALSGDYDLTIERHHAGRDYRVSRAELIEALGGIDDAGSLLMARRYLESLETDVIEG